MPLSKIRPAGALPVPYRGPPGTRGDKPAHFYAAVPGGVETVGGKYLRLQNADGTYDNGTSFVGPAGPSGALQSFNSVGQVNAATVDPAISIINILANNSPLYGGGLAAYETVVGDTWDVTSDGGTRYWKYFVDIPTPEQDGARGVGGYDDSAALARWAARPHPIKMAGRAYHTKQSINLGGIFLFGGGSITGDIDGVFADGHVCGFLGGSLDMAGMQISDLSLATAQYDVSASFVSDPGLAPGRKIILYNPTDGSWLAPPNGRTYYRNGTFAQVFSVSGNTIMVTEPWRDAFSAAAFDVYVLPQKTCTINDFGFFGPGDAAAGNLMTLRVSLMDAPTFNHVTAQGGGGNNCYIERCWRPRGHNFTCINRLANNGDRYGIVIAACHEPEIHGYFEGPQESLSVGGDGTIGQIPTEGGRFSGKFVGSTAVHGNTLDCQWHDAHITNGFGWGGYESGIKDSTVIVAGPYGAAGFNLPIAQLSESVGGVHFAHNTTFITDGDPSIHSRGVLDFGAGNGSINAQTPIRTTLQLRDVTIIAPNATGAIVRAASVAATISMNIDIRGLRARTPSSDRLVSAACLSGAVKMRELRVRDISEAPVTALVTDLTAATDGSTRIEVDTWP